MVQISPAAAATATTTTLASSGNPSTYGQAIALTATVSPGATGRVTFYDGTTILGTRTLSSGHALLATTLIASGTRSLRAYYLGDLTYAPSTSAVLMQAVKALPANGFQMRLNYDAGLNPINVAVGDFNGDGISDLAIANGEDSWDVNVLLGNGDGTFQAAVSYTTAQFNGTVAVGDFNSDGKPDLVVASADHTIDILFGNGDGTFQRPVNSDLGSSGSWFVVVGDFNGDGKADLAVAPGGGDLSVLLGNGDGTFQPPLNYGTGSSFVGSIAVGDFNGDGKADLAVTYANAGPNAVGVLLGNGNGTFQATVKYMTGGTRSGGWFVCSCIAVGDWNGDGRADLAVVGVSDSDKNLSVLIGNGDGTFQTPVNYTGGGSTIAAGDFNGDGRPDLVNGDLLLGNGDGTFQPARMNYIAGGVVGEFNGDGRSDLAIAGSGVTIMLGRPVAVGATLESVWPLYGTGSPQNFTATYSDPAGGADIGYATLLFNSTLNGAGACWIQYVRASNTLSLVNDAGSGPAPGTIHPGTPGTLSNSQCTIREAGAITIAGNNLILRVTITFSAGFTGSKIIYGTASTNANSAGAWQSVGTWTPGPAAPPQVCCVNPINSSGSPQIFMASYWDTVGPADLRYVTLLFNSSLSGSSACWIQYVRASNAMFLVNDAGSGLVPGSITPGNPGTLSNSQCTIGNAGPITTGSGYLTLPVAITFTPGFTGTKTVYAAASTNAYVDSNWQTMGAWSSQAPSVVSVSPINSSGSSKTFTATYSSPGGGADLDYVTLLFNSSFSGAGACWIQYFRSSNTMYLVNDAGSGLTPGSISPGTAGTLSNTQCTITNAGVVAISGNTLAVPVTVTFAAGFVGTKMVYGAESTNAHLAGPWQNLGTWNTGAATAPWVVSVSPINSGGSPGTFTAIYSDIAGGADLGYVTLLFNSSLNGAGACWIQYQRASNSLYLANDAGSGLAAGVISPGSAGTLSNSQCTIGNAGAATTSGNNLTLPMTVTFAAGFVGPKTAYGAASTNAHLDGNWQVMGTWTPH